MIKDDLFQRKSVQQPKRPGEWTSGDPLTVGDLRNAIAYLDDRIIITFGGDLEFYRFKIRGDELLHIELSNASD